MTRALSRVIGSCEAIITTDLIDISVTKGSVASNPASIPPDIKIFDRNDRSRYIQAMTLVTWNGRDNLVCIARKGGSVDIMDPETGETLKVIEEHKGHEDAYVSMEYRHGILSNCTASGNAFFQNLCYTNRFVHSLPNPVSVMRVHPTIPGIIAFGGKEQDLSIWVSDPDEDEESNEGLRESIIFQNFRPTWKAKNVKNDELDLRVPVWVSDVQFLQCSTVGRYKIVCVTRFHQVRIYDTQMARRPIMSVEVGEYPISSMILGRTPE